MFEQDDEIELRLPWSLICRMACHAFAQRVPFDKIVESALRDMVRSRRAAKK
jgi:hypothetical protein